MKKSVFVGLFFVCFALVWPFTVTRGNTVFTIMIDVIPDFIGFSLIILGLDHVPYINRRLKDVKNFATGCAVLSFITIISQLYPFFSGLITIGGVGSGGYAAGIVLSGFSAFYAVTENLVNMIYMIFVAYFCFAIESEMKKRLPTADKTFKGSRTNAYGETTYSHEMYCRFGTLSKIFTYVYGAVAALYAANQIYAFINWGASGIAKGLVLRFFQYEFGLWAFLIPVHILFLLYASVAVNICAQNRIDPTPEKGG